MRNDNDQDIEKIISSNKLEPLLLFLEHPRVRSLYKRGWEYKNDDINNLVNKGFFNPQHIIDIHKPIIGIDKRKIRELRVKNHFGKKNQKKYRKGRIIDEIINTLQVNNTKGIKEKINQYLSQLDLALYFIRIGGGFREGN